MKIVHGETKPGMTLEDIPVGGVVVDNNDGEVFIKIHADRPSSIHRNLFSLTNNNRDWNELSWCNFTYYPNAELRL